MSDIKKDQEVSFVITKTPESGNIKQFGYDEDHQLLLVEFSYGGKYVYKDVPLNIAEEMKHASSVGKYIASVIKPKYEFEKVGK